MTEKIEKIEKKNKNVNDEDEGKGKRNSYKTQ